MVWVLSPSTAVEVLIRMLIYTRVDKIARHTFQILIPTNPDKITLSLVQQTADEPSKYVQIRE